MRRTSALMVTVLCAFAASLALPRLATAQGIDERIAEVRRERLAATQQRDDGGMDIRDRLNVLIDPVVIRDAPFDEAVRWWSDTTGVPVVVSWRALENDGIDIRQPITLELRNAAAPRVLGLIMRLGSLDVPLIYEITPWYIQIMTQQQANRHTVTRIYDIADLLHRVPNFDDAPDFSLSSILDSGGGSDRGGTGGGQGLFDTGGAEQRDRLPSKAERGEELAQLIRETIEPDIWQAHGGEHSSIRYIDKRLVVRAPLYVHAQIGMPSVAAHHNRRRFLVDRAAPREDNEAPAAPGVAGIDTSTTPTAGKTSP